MKLFTKYSRIIIVATILIFLGASAAFYSALHYVLLNQVDEDLQIEQREITTYVDKYNFLPEMMKVKDQIISYTPISAPGAKKHFSTVDVKDTGENDVEKFRRLEFSLPVNGLWYKISVSKSLEETDNITHSVLLISFSTILIILVVSFAINRIVLKNIWRPFYQSLETVKNFSIQKEKRLGFAATETEEFTFMNRTLETLTWRAQREYLALKTFSENAAHEIQTPIAIIRSKLDLLIQDEALTQKQSENLQSVYNAIHKLTTLNQHLLLLAKIENNQFGAVAEINFDIELEKKCSDFNELWQAEGLKVNMEITPVTVKMNGDLANILLNNLLSNATKYNYRNGALQIKLNREQLIIKNTSEGSALDSDNIFRRFYKPSYNSGSSGLGLSIIKQICEVSGMNIYYTYKENRHTFTIHFA